MPERVRVGLIGAGGIARTYHVPALQALPEVSITAVCSRTPEHARALGEEVGANWAGTDVSELLARPDVDAVLILTPNHTHVQIVELAAAARKPMLLQKPMGRTSAECRRMIEAAADSRTPLVVSFMHRYLPEVQQARRYIRDGLIGRIESVRLRNAPGNTSTIRDWFYRRELVGGGCALDIGVHGIDLLRYLIGEVHDVLFAATRTCRAAVEYCGEIIRPDNEDLALASYRLVGGTLVSHEISWSHRSSVDRFSMEIYGSEGSIALRTPMGPLAVYSRKLGNDWVTPRLTDPSMGVAHHRAFLRAVNAGGGVEPDGRDGLRAVEVVEALYQAAARSERA